MNIISEFVTQILGVPAIFVGLIALVGLLVQKKPADQVMAGTLKTITGFLILSAGAGLVVTALEPIGGMLEQTFGITGVVPNDEAFAAVLLVRYGSTATMTMLIAFVVNVLVARFTRLKYIYMTGHHLLYLSLTVTVMLQVHTSLTGAPLYLLGGIALGLYCPAIIALVQPYMDKVTGNAGIAYAHSSNIGAFLGGFLGERFGNPEQSTEDLNLPNWLGFFRDVTVATGFTMMIVYVLISIIAGPSVVTRYSGEQQWIIWAVMQGIQFGASITILLSGVRMIIAEIVPAFKGISEKIVPDALPGLDCPVVMPFAPNAWLIGFLLSFPLGIVFTLLLAGPIGIRYVVIAGVVPHFFCSGPAGVFGNATGGLRGCVIASVVSSVIISFGISLLVPLFGPELIASGTMFGETDHAVFGTLWGYFAKLLGNIF